MSVELDPVELGFRRPFTREVSQTLSLRNPASDPVAFKVKTTAPKQYCVRPNSGRIEPGKSVQVQVLLQAMKEDLPLEAKCKDKFLVQSVPITAEHEYSNVSELWSSTEKTKKGSIQEKKIRVFFLPPQGGVTGTPAKATTNGPTDDSPPPAYTPERAPMSTPSGSVVKSEPKSESKDLGQIAEKKEPNSASSVAAAIPTSAEELKAQLSEAKATITRLTEQQGLRQRKGADKKDDAPKMAQLGVQQAQAAGVPVPVVAGLCLISFLLAYFVF